METEFSSQEEMSVTKELDELGVPKHLKGYEYMRIAILIAIRDFSTVSNINKRIYPAIAKIYDTSIKNIEYDIRNAIEITWYNDIEHFKKFLNNQFWSDYPTRAEFIAAFATKILLSQSTEEKAVMQMITELGVPTHLKGYLYLQRVILEMKNSPETASASECYLKIAKSDNISDRTVRNQIELAKKAVWKRTPEKFKQFFEKPYWEKCPTTSEFLDCCIKKIQYG